MHFEVVGGMAKPIHTIDGASAKRKPSRAGVLTRKKLLDSAERLFAEHGYNGTAYRDIAAAANVPTALCSYHFDKKELLFEEVIRRRASLLTNEIVKGYKSIDIVKNTASENIMIAIEAYSKPIFRYRFNSSIQHKSYVKLISQLINTGSWPHLIKENFNLSISTFLNNCYAIFPEADRESIVNAYFHFAASQLFLCSYPDHFDEFKPSRPNKQKIQKLIDDFMRFSHIMFMSA